MLELEIYIQTYFGIPVEHIQKIVELFEPTTLEKNEYFTQTGKFCKKLSFIKSGNIRVFNYSGGKDVTQWISTKGEFITDLSSLIFNTPSRWNIQALTASELFTLHQENYIQIGKIVPQWKDLEKLFIAKCFLNLEDRVYSFLSMTAEERYEQLYTKNKELFNLVPLHYLASMLGMTPETLSRIRKKAIS